MFCVECGTEGPVYQSLCRSCLLKKRSFISLPAVHSVVFCPTCGAHRIKDSWRRKVSFESALVESLEEEVKADTAVKRWHITVDPRQLTSNTWAVNVTGFLEVFDFPHQERNRVEVRLKHNTCPTCSRFHGNYYEAIIQVRKDGGAMKEEELLHFEETLGSWVYSLQSKDPAIYITKMEHHHGGLDLYLGSAHAAQRLVRRFRDEYGAVLKTSSELVGRRGGRDVHRFTHSLRLPSLSKGDFCVWDDKVYRVKGWDHRSLSLVLMETGRNVHVRRQDAKNCKRLGGDELVRRMVVVSQGEKEVQVLDPDTLKSVELLKPSGYDVVGETIPVLKCERGMYPIPVGGEAHSVELS